MRIKETGVVFKWYQWLCLGFVPLYVFTHIVPPGIYVDGILPLMMISILLHRHATRVVPHLLPVEDDCA